MKRLIQLLRVYEVTTIIETPDNALGHLPGYFMSLTLVNNRTNVPKKLFYIIP